MAAGSIDNPVGHTAAHDCLEADQLKLSKDKIPLPISLQKAVIQRFAVEPSTTQALQTMEWEELLTYIRSIEDFDLSPLDAVLAQTEVIGDPATPKAGECAALRWVGTAFEHWEQNFPLEGELALKLRPLKAVLAVVALSDASFFTPGEHPLHQLLDALHDAAIGWQPGLGRAGQPVVNLFEESAADARTWLEQGNSNLVELADRVSATAQRSQARAERMTQRAAETERGRLRSLEARVTAASTINDALAKFPISSDIGSIVTGPWYDSAQLVILKFGIDSSEWQQMSATTTTLLESLQPPQAQREGQPATANTSIAGLPEQLKRWMLSLQHDSDALEQIASVIEYAHLRLLRSQPAEQQLIAPIPLKDKLPANDNNTELSGIAPGQWYQVSAKGGQLQRVQLAMYEKNQLLFCNQAGIRTLSLPGTEFAGLLESGQAQLLEAGNSFSRSLAITAGIDSDETLAVLTGEPKPAAPEPTADTDPQTSAENPANASPQAVATDEPMELEAEQTSEPNLPDSGRPELPMGTWLGFHDTDPPLLAKLALHDKVRRLLIFVNRKGIEQRRLEEDEYFELIQAGLVDILEAKNNFREQVERARARMQRHQQ